MNKSIPKGYTDKKSEDIRTEWNKAVIALGQERANELRSQRNQLTIEEQIEKLEAEFNVAASREQRKATDEASKTAAPEAVSTEPTSDTQSA